MSEEAKRNLGEYEKFYRGAFRETSIQKCVESAPKAAAAGFDITPTCACAADTLLASKSLDQLIKLETDTATKSEIIAVTAECLKTNPPTKESKE